MIKEIGSEFWTEKCAGAEKLRHVVFGGRSRGFLCGRTALDYIIRDAKQTVGFETVLLPSYCCHTMIEPFVRNGIRIRFYSVSVDKNGIACHFPSPKKEEALYLMPYFGFGMPESYQLQAKQWKFCILDETHCCFSELPIPYADWNIKYAYASYRKWSDIRGFAAANKISDDFALPYEEKYHKDYLAAKGRACMLKQDYIEKYNVFRGFYNPEKQVLS